MLLSADSEPRKLKRTLGLWSSVAINVGAIIGGGIFVVTGIVAGLAGSALIISMVIAGVIAFFTAIAFAELTAWQPLEGSVYEYGRQLISPTAGFLAGWMWICSNTFTGAAVALGFGYYLSAAFPGLSSNLVAAGICLVFTVVNLIGVRESATVNNILVTIKLAVLGVFVVYGALFFNSANFSPFIPLSSGVLFGAFFIFFAFGGFARIAVAAEEVKDAKRTVPRAMFLSLGISMAIYILVGIVAVGLLNPNLLANSQSPLSAAMAVTGNIAAVQVVAVGGLVATASVLLTSILGVSRMAFSMARNSDFPSPLSRLHKRFDTPYYAIIASGLIMSVLALFVPLEKVVALSTFSLLFYYSTTNIAAFRLKTANRRYHRVMHAIGLATCLLLFSFVVLASFDSVVIGLIFLFAGFVFYQSWKRWLKRPIHSNK